MNIEAIREIYVDDKNIDRFVNHESKNEILNELYQFNRKFSDLLSEVENLIEEKWVYIKNKKVYYHSDIVALVPDFNEFTLGNCSTYFRFEESTLNLEFNGYSGCVIRHNELLKIIDNECGVKNIVIQDAYTVSESKGEYQWVSKWDINSKKSFSSSSRYRSYHIPIFRLHNKNIKNLNSKETLITWIKNDLLPDSLSKESEKVYNNLRYNYKLGLLTIADDNIIKFKVDEIVDKLCNDIKESFLINGQYTCYSKAIKHLKDRGYLSVEDIKQLGIYERILNCETIRADIEGYDERILTDPNRGHWDLWNESSKEGFYLKLNHDVMARNPILDIKEDGVIGIDFGTKSTIVVYQENNVHTLPMRVGVGKYSKKIEEKHYENPTVMEFINIEKFLSDYKSKEGRPNTEWEDLTVSHTAFNSLMASSSEHYYSFFNELKQWAGDKDRNIKLRDKQGYEKVLKVYTELNENDFDPIEIYAYFIGLYINNMHNGIYLDYVLSFPVTYEKVIRDKILESFRKGLKKSLPETLVNNDEVMSRFRVQAGASEPAAYAICALEEYNFELKPDEKIFYGVFDFGGGTTDFDFGVWRESTGVERRRFDYVIEHFGAGGDQYLGGENLLELLAFEVFKLNQDKLREDGITFILPPECFKFPGSEILISNSQEARLNSRQVMEKLRAFWEKHTDYEKEFEKGILQVNLFNKSGELQLNYELSLDIDLLQQTLVRRIDKGVTNFFEALKLSFMNSEASNVEKVKILLAGNSSKSIIVKDLFNKHIENETRLINEQYGVEDTYFTIYPPLGTEEAYSILYENNTNVTKNDISRPTGKTGVAFGLIKSRAGGRIKVVDKNIKDTEIKFKYYLGYESKGKFIVEIDREITYGKWTTFVDAYYEDFEIYYTNLPEASSNKMSITEVLRKKCRISITSETANVYIRAVSPTVIEYVVAEDDKINKEDYLSEITQINLG